MKTTLKLEELRTLIRRVDDFAHDVSRSLQLESEARAAEQAILADGKVDDAEIQKLSDARLRLEILPGKRAIAEKALAASESSLQRLLQGEVSAWNKTVRELADAKVAEVEAALSPFYPDDPRRVRKQVASLEIPAVRAVRKMSFDVGSNPQPEPGWWAAQAARFVNHVAKHANAQGRA